MECKNILYYFCCCFYSEPDIQQEDSYITYNDISQRNNYNTSILDYTIST